MGKAKIRCDIFCNVIDNYGDIGVCWRLARQLANEYELPVRLWVDDLGALAKLCPEIDAASESQWQRGVEVRHWTADAFPPLSQPAAPLSPPPPGGEGGVAELVIEAFACELPESYIAAMAARSPEPVWINLEYLSAEDWVHGCHKLPSPHPDLPLTKYFFFPGFTAQTGGLILERDLLERRDAFQNDAGQQRAFWQSIGLEMPAAGTLKVSLFGYENGALRSLLDAWSGCNQPVLCVVPESRIMPLAGQYFGDAAPCAGKAYSRGNLEVRVLPFVEQERYDALLWACDVNFVRGEDSCVRAQWAGRPFVWQIYPQHDAVHLKKLRAFLMLYNRQLSSSASQSVDDLWQAWNRGGDAGPAASAKPLVLSGVEGSGQAWLSFVAARDELDRHARHWALQLAANDLALNLLDFCHKIGRMRALKIEGSKHENSTRSSRG